MALGAAITAGGAIIGGIASLFGKKSAAKKAYKRKRKLRRSAYQDTRYDMERAGLNPILAYKQGATSASPVEMAQVPDFGEALTRGAQAGVATAKEKREAETATPLRKSQEELYAEQLENARKQGRLFDQQWQQGQATAKASQILNAWYDAPDGDGVRAVIRNYIGGTSVVGRGVGEALETGRDIYDLGKEGVDILQTKFDNIMQNAAHGRNKPRPRPRSTSKPRGPIRRRH